MFPGQRTWVVPRAGEAWDDSKSLFFESMGDSVYRVDQQPSVDGYSIRKAIQQKNFEHVQRSVPQGIWCAIKDSL
jgi:hypothetical protein